MAQYSSYDQVGKKEDISDVVSNISPTKTPFQTLIGSEKVSNVIFQWQEDSLAAVRDNKNVEGFTASDATLTATTMRNNVTQILEKTIKISATADTVDTYGRAKETAYQLAKASEEVKRDLEHAYVGLGTNASVNTGIGTAREMASAQSQIAAGNTSSNGGTPRALTEALILTVDQALYTAGSEASYLMIKPADSLIVAGFAAVANTRSRDHGTGTKVVNVVDIYVTPFGEKKVVLNRFLKTTDALLFDPMYWKKAVLRPWSRTTLAKTGDNEMHMIVGEFSLKHLNQSASGLVTDLS